MSSLRLEEVLLSSLTTDPENAKLHPPEQIDAIVESIKKFGFADPIGIAGTRVIEGHGRLEAAKQLGMEWVPVIRLDHLSMEQQIAYSIAHNNMSPDDFQKFLRTVIDIAVAVTRENTYAFIWSGWSTIDQFAPVLRQFYLIKAMPIWVKNNFGIGYYSRPKYEPFFLCLLGNPEKPAIAPADVWEHAKVHETVHSCEKPVGLIAKILDAYVTGSLILDPFVGSGATLMACETTGRECFGVEINPAFCDIILSRWEKYSGQSAVKVEG